MYNKCCVQNCTSIRQDVKMHAFPMCDKRLKKWLKCIGSVHLQSLGLSEIRKMFVCHKHFESRFITSTQRLLMGAYPTLFTDDEIASNLPAVTSEFMVTTEGDHCYTRKRRHEDHTYYSKPADKTPLSATSSLACTEAFTAIENQTPKMETDSAQVCLTSSHALMAIENLPQMRTDTTQLCAVSSLQMENLPPQSSTETEAIQPSVELTTPKPFKGHRKCLAHRVKTLSPKCKQMYKEYLRSKRQLNFHKRAKRALKFAKSDSFEKLTAKMNPLSKKIFWMQLKQCTKKVKGRRFTIEEKMIALSIMKQSPKCYKFLKRIFILPSRNTLNKMISGLKVLPGINKQIFDAIKQEVSTWSENKKYCSILFDEMSLQPGLNYDKARDAINGFVELKEKSNDLADHALSFMLRGAVYKWQQPIAFYFCEGTTNKNQLKVIMKEIVAAVVDAGLLPVALISDQGSSFQSALRNLLEETRGEQLRAGKSTDEVISLSGHDLSVIFDPPHLIKGIRNNFLTKNIVSMGKTSKWSDIIDVYKTDCNHAQARLLHKLTDRHVQPSNRDKMKVQNCTRVLSKTVAAALYYTSQFSHYSDGRPVSGTSRNTAELVSFYDDLFDSCNGASLSGKNTRGKNLRKAVTEKSEHHGFWNDAIKKLGNMKFVEQESGEVTGHAVPSLKNWVVTLKSFQRLWQFFKSKGIKIMRTRYFNSDPIENFFGQVRAYNFRSNDPDCHSFTSTYRSLLITRFIKFHSDSYNCENVSEKQILNLKDLFVPTETLETEVATMTAPYINNCEHENLHLQARRERLHVHSRAYTAGWLVKKILEKVNSCDMCKKDLTTTEKGSIHDWISHREYNTVKKNKLTYPSEYAVKYFGNIVKESNEYLEKEPHNNDISEKIKHCIASKYSFDFVKCSSHKTLVIEYFMSVVIRFTIFNWCNTINRIMRGTDVLRLTNKNLPNMQNKALKKYTKKLKNKNR